ncbi:MAG: TolC family protein [Myxococcales bacterium]|jgi:cobalt-zinc-cadmium efflux system outer membrane protein
MFRRRLVGLVLGVSLRASPADAQQHDPPIIEMTYEGALALARKQAPVLTAARARARDAHSRIDAASVWRFNPELSGDVGPRFGASRDTVDWSVRVQQWLEVGGQRGDRLDAARAGAAAGGARARDATRRLLGDVGLAFAAVLYWERRAALAEENLHIAEAVARVARRRHAVGDVGGMDDAVSALGVVRARTALDGAMASRTQTEGGLKALLGLRASTVLACRGELRELGELQPGSADPDERPDLRALRADIRKTDAEAALGRARRVPNLSLGAGYFRRESEDVIRGLVTVELPVFDRGQGETAVAVARGERLRAELDATRATAAVGAETARSAAERLGGAVARFEREGLEILERAERLATASYEAGAVPLGELLAVRRELVQAKLDHVELLLRAATARVVLAATTGALR